MSDEQVNKINVDNCYSMGKQKKGRENPNPSPATKQK